MDYGKLEDGNMVYAPKTVEWNGHTVNNPSVEKLMGLGYYPVMRTDIPDSAPEGKHFVCRWVQRDTGIVQIWDLADNIVYTKQELTAEEALQIIVGGTA